MTLARAELYPLGFLVSEGVSPSAVEAYLEIGFVEAEEIGGELFFRRRAVERIFRAERIRRELGANLIGAALVVEVLEAAGR